VKTLILKPKLSEKAYALSEQRNTYTFEVPTLASKQAVAQAVAKAYGVNVTAVRKAGVKGKTKRTFRRGMRSAQSGQRADIRKAYVTLKEGDKLPIFAAVEDNAKSQADPSTKLGVKEKK